MITMETRPATNGEGGSDVAWGLDCSEAGTSVSPSSRGRAFIDAEDNLKFYPPLYRQRYETVGEILKDGKWSPPLATVIYV